MPVADDGGDDGDQAGAAVAGYAVPGVLWPVHAGDDLDGQQECDGPERGADPGGGGGGGDHGVHEVGGDADAGTGGEGCPGDEPGATPMRSYRLVRWWGRR